MTISAQAPINLTSGTASSEVAIVARSSRRTIAPPEPINAARRASSRIETVAGDRDQQRVVGAEQQVDDENLDGDGEPRGAGREVHASRLGGSAERRARREAHGALPGAGAVGALCGGFGPFSSVRRKSASGDSTSVGPELASALR